MSRSKASLHGRGTNGPGHRRRAAKPAAGGWRRPAIGAVAAVPVGLGLAAALTLASASTGQSAPGSGGDIAAAVPDDARAPSADPSAGASGEHSGEQSEGSPSPTERTETPREQVSAQASVAASQIPKESQGDGGGGSGGSEGEDTGGSSGSADAEGSGGGDRSDQAAALSTKVVNLVNEQRAQHGCGPVHVDERLSAASQAHSEDMAARDYMSHETPEGEGPGDRAEEVGYEHWTGENIAAGQTSAQQVMNAWMNSEGHRKNILNCDSQAIGVGFKDNYWTQMFGAV